MAEQAQVDAHALQMEYAQQQINEDPSHPWNTLRTEQAIHFDVETGDSGKCNWWQSARHNFVPFLDPSEVYEWLMSNPATPCIPDNMDAVGWERWLMALGIPRLFASEYGRSMEHKGLVLY